MNSNPLRAAIGLVLVGVFVYFTFFAGYGSKVTDGNVEVFYKDSVTKDEAQKLAAHLGKLWAAAPDKRRVQLVKPDGQYRFRMVVKPEYHNDNVMQAQLGIVGSRISRDVLNGSPVEVDACDDHLKTVKTIPIPTDFQKGTLRGKIEVFHANAVTKEEADKFLEFATGEFANAPAPIITFSIGKSADTYAVSMGFRRDMIDKPGIEEEMQAMRERIAKTVFAGAPVEMRLCDDNFIAMKTLKP